MSKICFIFLILICTKAFAESPIEPLVIDHNNAKKYGFKVKEYSDAQASHLELKGPKTINGCSPSRAGSALVSHNNKELSLNVATLDPNSPSEIIGYIRHNTNYKLVIFIDYLCPKGIEGKSRSYQLSSKRT